MRCLSLSTATDRLSPLNSTDTMELNKKQPEEDEGGSSAAMDMRNELSNLSFEEIIKLQQTVGTKVYNKVTCGSKSGPDKSKSKRLNKNRPTEISAKKPVPFLRQVVPVKKTMLRDPRFDDLSGEYKADVFEKTYSFIDDIKSTEKKVIQRQLKRMKKDSQKKTKLQFLLKRMENQERAKKIQELQKEKELEFKRQQRENANASHGTRPFFLKKSEKKKLQLADKYQELKKSGKLDHFLSKKRKRNAEKDRRKLPPKDKKTK
uniref:rRNA biogenesis protein RRP36 n=1 Tax=Gouania willdenowi TaxID=441366 RepID=A0A8C5HP50_GOUWI